MKAQIAQKKIKGYKQTEIGVIPEDWNVIKVGDCLIRPPRYGIGAAAVDYSDRLPKYIRITDISETGRFLPKKTVSVDNLFSANYFLSEGDLVVARTGASVGKSYLYRPKDGPLVFAGFLICLSSRKNILLPQYLSNYFKTMSYWNWVKLTSMRSGQPGINGNEFARLLIPLPYIQEQIAIATVLSDTDALIEHLGKLIAKKKAIKQGAIQQLLTCKRRLPGFSGEWEVKTVKEVVQVPVSDGPHLTPKFIERGIPFLSVNNLVDNKINFKGMRFISAEDHKEFSKKCKPQKGDILLGKAASVGLVAVANLEIEFNIWSPIAVIRLQENHNPYFFYYSFQNKTIIDNMRLLTNSSSQGNLGMCDIEKIKFLVPTKKEEQDAIVRILSDMDAQIERLEKKHSKYRQIKTGMMQQLLTGKIRLGKN